MVERRLSIRLALLGGDAVKAEFDSLGKEGQDEFRRLEREAKRAEAQLASFGRRAVVALGAAATAVQVGAAALVRSSLATVDAQAKMAQSLGTTVESMQVLTRAGDLAGVSMSGIEQATKDLTRRLSQAAAGTGPAADALARLGLSATELADLPLDERVAAINGAIEAFVPAAERAAVAGQLFGEEGSIAMSRIDTATLRQATEDLERFGVVVSEQDADQIERTNDAVSRLGLIWTGLGNRLAVQVAPTLEALAEAMAALFERTGLLGRVLDGLGGMLGRVAATAGVVAGLFAGRYVAGLAAAALTTVRFSGALVVLRGALIRTGIGALVVGAGELVFQFGRLVTAAGGFGGALQRLGAVAGAVWSGIRNSAEALRLGIEGVFLGMSAAFTSAVGTMRRAWADFAGWLTRQTEGIPFLEDYLAGLSRAAEQSAEATQTAAAGLRALSSDRLARSGELFASAFDGVGETVAALFATVDAAADGAAGALQEAAAGAAAVAEESERAGAAGRAAMDTLAASTLAVKDATEEASTAIEDTVGAAFRHAEDAIAKFVSTGKIEVRELVASIASDMARLAIRNTVTGPLSSALGAALAGAFGGPAASAAAGASFGATVAPTSSFVAVSHSGGVVGGASAMRRVPSEIFAGAPRMHGGGIVGLGPRERPAILEAGETVLPRGVAPGVAVTLNVDARGAGPGAGAEIAAALDRFVRSPTFAAGVRVASQRRGVAA